jgi:putative transposase
MPRKARIVATDCAFHVTQRGNNRQDTFLTLEDRALYLKLLAEHTRREWLDVVGYCLMTNHVHLIVVPRTPKALARALGRTHSEYALHANRSHGRSGHLWQNRFYSCPLDEEHLWIALRYVEQNPVRAHLATTAGEWGWSSAREHLGARAAGPVRLRMREWLQRFTAAEWAQCLAADSEPAQCQVIRERTRNGWALGSAEFCEDLEKRLKQRVRPLPVGCSVTEKPAFAPSLRAGTV